MILPIALILLVPLLVLQSQAALLAVINWSLDNFTELRLETKNPDLRLPEGRISADEIHLLPRGQGGPALFSVLDLDVTTTLWELLSRNLNNTLVSASQVLIYVSENDQARDPKPGSWMQLTEWLPSQLYIGQVHLITAAENTWIFPLRDLQGRRLDGTTFRSRALADYEGEALEVNLDIFGTRRDGRVQSLDIKAGFFAPESDSQVSLEGKLEGRDEKFRYDFTARANYSDIGEFLRGLASDSILQGRLDLEARMIGTSRQFTLSDASLVLDNMPDYGFEAAGELSWERGGESRLKLIAAGELADLGYLVDWIDLDLQALGRAKASINLSGSLDAPAVDHFVLVTQSDSGLSVNVSGTLGSLAFDPNAPMSTAAASNEIRVDAHAPSASVLSDWIENIQFEPGPWRASWVTRGDRQTIELSDIVVETGTEQTLLARVEGRIGAITNTPELGLAAFSDIDLRLEADTQDSVYLSRLTGFDLPPYHALKAQLRASGRGEELELSDGTLSIRSSDLQAIATGVGGRYRPGHSPMAFTDLSAGIEVSVSDTAVLSQYTDLEVPFLGPAELTASLTQTDSGFGLENVDLRIDGEELSLNASGKITDLEQFQGLHLKTGVERLDTAQVLAITLGGFEYDGELGQLYGGFDLINTDGAWRVADLALNSATAGEKMPLAISVDGDIFDLAGFPTANLEASLKVDDMALLEAITGLRLRPVTARLSAMTRPGHLTIDATGRAGDTELASEVRIAHGAAGISRLEARLSTPHLYLSDLGLQVDADTPSDYAPGAGINTEARTGLEALLEKSPAYPTDIQLKVAGITGRNTNIDRLDVHVTGDANRYTLRQFSLIYDDAEAEIRGVVDLNPSPPFASIAGEAIALPLSTLAQDLGAPSDIRGTLTARGGVAASGTDIPALMATLNGSLAIALEDTVIQGAAYDILATDFLAWLYSGAALEDSTHLDCTLARFDIRDGVARTDSIYVESQRMIATGEGKFDLAKRQLDLTLTPRSRSRSFQIPSEIRLRGDMSEPRVTISPVKAAADASAQALLLIPKLALRLFGGGGRPSDKGIQPCQAALQ